MGLRMGGVQAVRVVGDPPRLASPRLSTLSPLYDVRAGQLEQVLFIELLENARLDLRKVPAHQQRQQALVVAVQRDVQRRDVQVQHHAVEADVHHHDHSAPEHPPTGGAEPAVPVEAVQSVLPEAAEEAVEHLHYGYEDVQLYHGLTADPVVEDTQAVSGRGSEAATPR